MPIRVLIADDDEFTRDVIIRAVKDDRTEVVAVTSGAELVAALKNGATFDLIITDLMMPWMNGATALRAMRNAGVDTPFVVVTGMDPTSTATLLAKLEGVTVLRKPLSLAGLRGVVRGLLGAVDAPPAS